jgi:hypothetical protein
MSWALAVVVLVLVMAGCSKKPVPTGAAQPAKFVVTGTNSSPFSVTNAFPDASMGSPEAAAYEKSSGSAFEMEGDYHPSSAKKSKKAKMGSSNGRAIPDPIQIEK